MRPPPRTADWTRSEHVIYKTSHDVVKMKSHCSRLVCDNGPFLSPSYWLTLENVCFGSIVVSKTQWGPVYSGSSRCFLTPPRKKNPMIFLELTDGFDGAFKNALFCSISQRCAFVLLRITLDASRPQRVMRNLKLNKITISTKGSGKIYSQLIQPVSIPQRLNQQPSNSCLWQAKSIKLCRVHLFALLPFCCWENWQHGANDWNQIHLLQVKRNFKWKWSNVTHTHTRTHRSPAKVPSYQVNLTIL